MSKCVDIEVLEKEHQTLLPKCEIFCIELSKQIQFLIEQEKIQLAVPIQFRAKTFSSVSEKVKNGRFNIKKSVHELQDLSGIRIITLFKGDAQKVVDLLNDKFEILNQYNTEDKLQENEFGYTSIHIVGKLKESWLDIPSFSEFKEFKFEAQIRTLSQHSWAEASNIFQYKKEESVPKPLKRSISRISALLEIIDLEFERLLAERQSYKEEMKETLIVDSILDVDILENLLTEKLPIEHKTEDEEYSDLLEDLNVLGFSTVKSLSDLINKQLPASLEENKRISEGSKKMYKDNPEISYFEKYYIEDCIGKLQNGIYFTQAGLIRQMLTLEYGRSWIDVHRERLLKIA